MNTTHPIGFPRRHLSFVPELKIKMVAAKRHLHGNSPPYPRSREKGREGKGRGGEGRQGMGKEEVKSEATLFTIYNNHTSNKGEGGREGGSGQQKSKRRGARGGGRPLCRQADR
jgi:hypothetical protein